MFADKEVKAIISAFGGDNSFNCLGLIDYENIKRNPKIITGYSDATNYLEAIHTKTGLVTYHHADTEDMKIEDVFMRHLKDYDFPILKCDDFGHDCENIVVPIGAKVRLDASNCKVEILEEV